MQVNEETQASLTIAEKLLEILENDSRYEELYFNCPLAIHVDAGNSNRGKTKELIPELVGWIKSCGYDCQIKPDSFVASSIADRLTKWSRYKPNWECSGLEDRE